MELRTTLPARLFTLTRNQLLVTRHSPGGSFLDAGRSPLDSAATHRQIWVCT